MSKKIFCDEWRGCYRRGWGSLLVSEAFAHPAKVARGLAERIYQHVLEERWAKVGDCVIDPFGGIAGFGFHAMMSGLNFVGCELEEKFVTLGNQNIALWHERFSRMPNWGSAILVQGDSRKLVDVLRSGFCCVSSPPYVNSVDSGQSGIDWTKAERPDRQLETHKGKGVQGANGHEMRYGESEGQLGAMKEGDHSLVISSPPYIDSVNSQNHGIDWSKVGPATGNRKRGNGTKHEETLRAQMAYTENPDPANLGAMPEGQLCVTSPPYNPPMSQDHNGTRGGQRGTTPSEKGAFAKYGNSEGQLEGMSMDGFSAAVSSPPYENAVSSERNGIDWDKARKQTRDGDHYVAEPMQYGVGADNLGNQRGETFWSASRLILEQLNQVLVPGGHAVFVVKAFVRDKKIVDFPAQWAQLCEAVGFRLLHDHHALLTEHYGTQGGFDEDKKLSIERKSFFRRLAESKGSPRIDHENVLCFERVT